MLESLFNKYRFMSRWLYYKETPTQVFYCEYCQIFKNLTSINDCLWTLLIQSGRNNRKNRDVSRDDNRSRIQNPVKHLRCSFCKKGCLYLTVDYFCETLHVICFQGYEHALIKLNKILVCCQLFRKKLGLQSL